MRTHIIRKTTLVSALAAGLALLPVCGAFAAALNPTPTRASKLIAGFENDADFTATSDPDGAGENRVKINTDPEFVAEGSKSLVLDLSGVGAWKAEYFVVELPQPIDIKGHQVLTMDVFIPVDSMDNGVPEGGWWQFTPHITTTNADDETATTEHWLGMRQMGAGWNHLVFDLKTGSDTKITRLAFAGNTNEAKPYSGPVYVDNIRVYEGSFHGIKPDEQLIFGFDKATDAELFTGAQGVEINTDKQFVRDGEGSLKIDMTAAEGGWTSDVIRADDLGATVNVSKATAIHLDLFVPEGSQPESWHEMGYVLIGEGGEVWGSTVGLLAGQWNTLVVNLTPEQATTLGTLKGIYFLRNQDSATPWRGPVYVDNLRAVVPAE